MTIPGPRVDERTTFWIMAIENVSQTAQVGLAHQILLPFKLLVLPNTLNSSRMALRFASMSSDSKLTLPMPFCNTFNTSYPPPCCYMSLPVCKTPCLSALKSNELLDVRTVFAISSVTVPTQPLLLACQIIQPATLP